MSPDDEQPDEPTYDGSGFDRLTPEQRERLSQGRSPFYEPPTTPDELLDDVRTELDGHALDGVMALLQAKRDFEAARVPAHLIAEVEAARAHIVEHLNAEGRLLG